MRCYFHVVSPHESIFDEAGIEVTDLQAAEAEALRAIKDIREEDGEADEVWQGWQLQVADGSGHVLLCLPLDEPPQKWSLARSGEQAAFRSFWN